MMKLLVYSICCLCLVGTTVFGQQQTIYPQGLRVGDTAPDFSGINQNGEKISLSAALKKGDVVMLFYRGQWCPHCRKQLSNYSDSLQLVTAKGATVLAVTPETAENIAKAVKKTKSDIPIIEDKGLTIMKLYKVNFEVDENTISKYKGYGIDFDKANGENGANLPVPATYIIGKDRKIKYVFFNTDYKKRASVLDILNNL